MATVNAPQGLSRGRYLALSSVTDLITTGVAFGTGLLIARYLGPHDRGLYSLVTTVGGLVAFLFGMGLFESLLSRNLQPTRRYFRLALGLGVIGALVMLVAALATDARLFGVYAIAPVMWGLLQISLARAALRQSWGWLLLRLTPSAIQLVITVYLWSTGRLTVEGALLAVLFGYAVTLFLDRALNGASPVDDSRLGEGVRAVLVTGGKQHMLNVPRMLNYRGPILVLGVLSTPEQVGLFAVASAVGSLVPALSWSLTQNLLVLTARTPASAATTRKRMVILGYAVSFGMAALTPLIGERLLVFLYGAQFGSAWLAFGIVAAIQGFWLHSGLVQTAYRAGGVPQWAAAIEGIGIVVMVCIMLLTQGSGYLSAAIGTAASCMVTLVAVVLLMRIRSDVFGPQLRSGV